MEHNIPSYTNLLYEDEFIIAVNKPNNLLIHNSYYARNIRETTLLEGLQEHFNHQYFPLHRLDRKTSGVILLCKRKEDIPKFQEIFNEGKIEKIYYGIVRGFSPANGIIDTPVKHPESRKYKEAETLFESKGQATLEIPVHPYPSSRYSLIRLVPKTGRIHQLRIHLNKISHPLVGDYKYGDRFHNRMYEENFGMHNLFLHAFSVKFEHPVTKEETYIKAEFPDNWKTLFERFEWDEPIS